MFEITVPKLLIIGGVTLAVVVITALLALVGSRMTGATLACTNKDKNHFHDHMG